MALWKLWSSIATGEVDKIIDSSFRTLGYRWTKELQNDAIHLLLNGHNVFFSVPTGFGKSVIFHTLPECAMSLLKITGSYDRKPCMLVVPSLLSLMADQVAKLNRNGAAVVIQLDKKDYGSIHDLLSKGLSHVLTSPEAILGVRWGKLR